MKKVYIFHSVTSLILLGSIGACVYIFGGFWGGAEPENDVPDVTSIAASLPESSSGAGGVPFTLEEFERSGYGNSSLTGRERRRFFRFLKQIELPALMEGYWYTPGLAVTVFDSKELEVAYPEMLPGEWVFLLKSYIRKGDQWVYEVIVQNNAQSYTMYVPEESLLYAGFYGLPPQPEIVAEYEAKRLVTHEAIEQREADRQVAYQVALDEYWALEAKNNPDPFWVSMQRMSFEDVRGVGVYAVLSVGFISLAVIMLMVVVWLRTHRPWQRDVTFDEITAGTEGEPDPDPSYSAFSERGADFYDPKEDEMADSRF